jgi:hypothetical protein
MSSNARTACQPRRWGVGVGLASATVAAAMIGLASTPSARADTPEDVLGQALQDLAQASLVLEQAPQASLDAHFIATLTPLEDLIANTQSFTSSLAADQADLPGADQAGLADVDLAALHADQGVLDAANGFLAADQAGDLTSWASGLPTEFATLNAELAAAGAALDVGLVDLGAEFFNAIGVPDFFLP